MRGREDHQKLNEAGEGRCSVPMWQMGMQCFCDAPAYGERPEPSYYWRDAYTGQRKRSDGLYDGYVPGLACHAHGGPKHRAFLDGNAWCAVPENFTNIQESPCGFGATPELARKALEKELAKGGDSGR